MAVETVRSPAREAASMPNMQRTDSWWASPLGFFLLFSAFGAWATFRAFQNNYYDVGSYLSPFYSPTVILPYKLLGIFKISPALLILVFPLSFRLSCYYYRKSIYRAYIADPPSCAVVEPKPLANLRYRRYTGEQFFPMAVMNFHRYAFYAAVVFIIILWKDAIATLFFTDPATGASSFGIHVGTIIFFVDIVLLSLYTFSCHSWRHLIGGGVDCYSCSVMNRTRHGLWRKVSFLNETHGLWAMMSLVSVALTDAYVFLVASKAITDFRIFGG